MLTTTLDGLWVLQVLTGIEVLCPELRLRPHLPSVETKQMAFAHPVTAELTAEGVIDAAGTVDAAVVEWLTVVSRRDVALLMQVRTPADGGVPAQVVLCRFAQWWVVIERSGDLVRISGAGLATAEGSASALITSQLDRLCGVRAPAVMRPVTLDGDALRAVTSRDSLRRFLVEQKLDAEQLQTLMWAADPARSAQASIVAIQTGIESGLPTRSHIEQSVVSIIDTREGRVLAEHVPVGTKKWMIISPGTGGNVASAVKNMLRRLPAEQDWFSYRKVV